MTSFFCTCAVGEDELRHSLGLATCTTGKGKVALDPNTRAIEVFMCSVVSAITIINNVTQSTCLSCIHALSGAHIGGRLSCLMGVG